MGTGIFTMEVVQKLVSDESEIKPQMTLMSLHTIIVTHIIHYSQTIHTQLCQKRNSEDKW